MHAGLINVAIPKADLVQGPVFVSGLYPASKVAVKLTRNNTDGFSRIASEGCAWRL